MIYFPHLLSSSPLLIHPHYASSYIKPPSLIPYLVQEQRNMSKQVKVVTNQTIKEQGATGGQTDGMIRENAITGMSERMCSSG